MALVYLAGPIDGVSFQVAADWRHLVGECLASFGHVAYLPNGAFYQGKGLTPVNAGALIEAVNRDVIRRAHALIADLTHTRSVGTIREIEAARRLGRPVLVFVSDEAPSSMSLWDCRVHQVKAGFWTEKAHVVTLPGIISAWLEEVNLGTADRPVRQAAADTDGCGDADTPRGRTMADAGQRSGG